MASRNCLINSKLFFNGHTCSKELSGKVHHSRDIPAPCLGRGFPSEGSLLGNFLMEVVLTLVSCLHSLLKVIKIILPIFKSIGLQTSSPRSQAASECPEPKLLEQGRA